jgi:hypothetical protein
MSACQAWSQAAQFDLGAFLGSAGRRRPALPVAQAVGGHPKVGGDFFPLLARARLIGAHLAFALFCVARSGLGHGGILSWFGRARCLQNGASAHRIGVVYASEHLAIAAMEKLVHLKPGFGEKARYVCFRIYFGDVAVETVDAKTLAPTWHAKPPVRSDNATDRRRVDRQPTHGDLAYARRDHPARMEFRAQSSASEF